VRSQYPVLPNKPSAQEMEEWVREVTRLRQTEDVPDFTNLPNVLLSGRLVEKIPTSSADVAATDVQNDFSYAADGAYMYVLVDDTGTLKWGRISVDTAW